MEPPEVSLYKPPHLAVVPVALTQQGQGYGRRLFLYEKKLAPMKDAEIIKDLADATSVLVTRKQPLSIKARLAEIFQYLYQKNAQIDSVETTHTNWSEVVDGMTREIRAKKTITENCRKYIHLMTDENELGQALKQISALEEEIALLGQKAETLLNILQNGQHSTAFEYFKKKVKECESLKSKTIAEKLDGLNLLLTEAEAEMKKSDKELIGKPKVVVDEVHMLHKWLLRFFRYSTSCFAKEAVTQAQTEQLSTFSNRLNTHLGDQEENLDTLENTYVRDASTVELPTANYFRNGQALLFWRYIPYCGSYLEIKEEVDKLQGIAKAIYKMMQMLDERLMALCHGNVTPAFGHQTLAAEKHMLIELVNRLEPLVRVQDRALTKKPFSDKIHAGWYYVAAQLVQLDEVRLYIEEFSQRALGKFLPYSIAYGMLIEYVSPADPQAKGYFTSIQAVTRLFDVIVATCPLEKPTENASSTRKLRIITYELLDDTISKVGPRTLALIGQEILMGQNLLASVNLEEMAEAHEDTNRLPEAVRCYLMKRFIMQLHFQREVMDPELDLILHALNTDDSYKEAFRRTLALDARFRTLYQTYLQYTDMAAFAKELELMRKIFIALGNCNPNVKHPELSKARTVFRYSVARQLFLELAPQRTDGISESQQRRLTWAKQKADARLHEIEMLNSFPKFIAEFDTLTFIKQIYDAEKRPHIYYKHLVTALYATDESKAKESQTALLVLLETEETKDIPHDQIVGLLLQNWMLQYFKGTQQLKPKFQQQLITFMAYCVSSVDRLALWRQIYDIGFMEIALYRALQLETQQIQHQKILTDSMHNFRGKPDFDRWQEIVKRYAEFRAICENNRVIILNSPEHRRCLKLIEEANEQIGHVSLEPDDTEYKTHVDLWRWCYNDMFKMWQTPNKIVST